jgi:hypothetical protein
MSSLALSLAHSPAQILAASSHREALATAAPAWNARSVFAWSRKAMGYSAVVAVAATALAYPLAHELSLPAQIVAHLAIPVAAGVFKLGYVARLAAQEAMARSV